MEPVVVSGVGAASSLIVELLSRVVARRTGPGQAHVILSESELDERIRDEVRVGDGDEGSIRALRNALVHGVVATTNYDDLLDFAISVDDRHRLRRYESLRDQLREEARVRLSPEESGDAWLETAVLVADAFVQLLVEAAETVTKLEPDEAERIGRAAAESAIAAARWSQVVGDRLDTTAVARLLGITRQALAKRQASGSVLGLPGRGTTWYPTWQLNLTSGEIRPEVRDIIGAFRDRLDDLDPLVIASWAVTPQEEDLDGHTPEQWLRLGKSAQQLRVAAERAASRLAR